MTSPTEPREPWGFGFGQRLAFGILLAVLLVFLFLQFQRRPARLEDGISRDPNPMNLPSRVDPNTASALELTRIPNLGEALARKIIDYRETHKATAPDQVVFRQPEDLYHVSGLKQKSLAPLLPYLEFPEDPATQPVGEP